MKASVYKNQLPVPLPVGVATQPGSGVESDLLTDTNAHTGQWFAIWNNSASTLTLSFVSDSVKTLNGTPPNTVAAGAFVVGQTYTIVSVGSTNFTAIGATANQAGVTFVATGVGSGSGTATLAGTGGAYNAVTIPSGGTLYGSFQSITLAGNTAVAYRG